MLVLINTEVEKSKEVKIHAIQYLQFKKNVFYILKFGNEKKVYKVSNYESRCFSG